MKQTNTQKCPEGRHTDVTSIGMAKHRKGTQPKPMSEGYFTRLKSMVMWFSRLVRLGAARNMKQRGNYWPLVGRCPQIMSWPTRREGIEMTIFGWNIVVTMSMTIVHIADILNDDADFMAEIAAEGCRNWSAAVNDKPTYRPETRNKGESA